MRSHIPSNRGINKTLGLFLEATEFTNRIKQEPQGRRRFVKSPGHWDQPHSNTSRNKVATTVDHEHRENGPWAASAPVKIHFARTYTKDITPIPTKGVSSRRMLESLVTEPKVFSQLSETPQTSGLQTVSKAELGQRNHTAMRVTSEGVESVSTQ